MEAIVIKDAIAVLSTETLPDGVQVCRVSCFDYSELLTLPHAIELDGIEYGRTGWNSDRHVAYYRSDKEFARRVS